MKRVFIILLVSLFLFCGVGGAADVSTFYVEVFDSTNGNTPIEGASVSLTGSEKSTLYTTSAGTAEFKNVKYPETYTVTVSKSGYTSQTISVAVSEANQRSPVYLSAETPILLTVTSTDGTVISGATVTINKKAAGKTDENGRLHAAMIRGAYNTLEISAPSYNAYSKEVFLEKNAVSLNVQLTVSKVSPLILVYSEDKSPISGASVSIDGKVVAYTDSYGRAQLASYTAGTYELQIQASKYLPYTAKVEFTSANPSTTVILSSASSTVTIKAMAGDKPVADTVIYIDGDIKGITDASGVYTLAANPDTKLYISASHEGYTAEGVTYIVQNGEDNTVVIEMKQNVPVVLIGIAVLAVIIALLIVILVVSGKKRGKKSVQSPAKSYPPTNRRDSL